MKSVIFLLLVAGICAVNLSNGNLNLWDKIPGLQLQPCEDFSHAVCDNKTSIAAELPRKYQEQVDRAFKDFQPDSVTQELYKAIEGFKGMEHCSSGSETSPDRPDFGEFVVYGLTEVSAKVHPDSRIIEVRMNNESATPSSGSPRRYGSATIRMPFNYLRHKKLKNLVSGYLKTIDFQRRFNVMDFDVVYEKDVVAYIESTRSFKSSFRMDTRTLNAHQDNSTGNFSIGSLQNNRFLGVYTNLLMASVLLKVDPNLVHNRNLVRKVRGITEDVLKEIELHFDEIEWMSQRSKEKLKRLHTIDDFFFGPSEAFLNETMVGKALNFYQDFFKKQALFKSEDMRRFKLPGGCELGYYYAMSRVADQAFQLYHEVDFGHSRFYSFFVYNAINQDTKLYLGMPFIYGYDRDIPMDYIYGTIGYIIGHEIFHSYGVEQILTDDVHDVLNSNTYQEAVKCIEDYYSSFVGPKGLKPNGTFKAHEGFSDLQSARVITKLVKRRYEKLIRGNNSAWPKILLKNQKATVDNALRMAFVGMTEFYCERYLSERNDDNKQLNNIKNDSHPRYTVRANAIVRQVAEFSDVFRCRPDEQLYHIPEKACDAFPTRQKFRWQ
uniref:Peptidase_M13 domain-containing protein n=1 Tax=Steinernema glaseri TaxID=37863 RepID=A0A1I8AJL1_9BILA